MQLVGQGQCSCLVVFFSWVSLLYVCLLTLHYGSRTQGRAEGVIAVAPSLSILLRYLRGLQLLSWLWSCHGVSESKS